MYITNFQMIGSILMEARAHFQCLLMTFFHFHIDSIFSFLVSCKGISHVKQKKTITISVESSTQHPKTDALRVIANVAKHRITNESFDYQQNDITYKNILDFFLINAIILIINDVPLVNSIEAIRHRTMS